MGMSESQRLESSILFGLSTNEHLGNRIAADAVVLANRDRRQWQRMPVVLRREGWRDGGRWSEGYGAVRWWIVMRPQRGGRDSAELFGAESAFRADLKTLHSRLKRRLHRGRETMKRSREIAARS